MRNQGSNGHKKSREVTKSGAFFRAPDPFVLFVSFVVKRIPETKTDSTAENVEIAGEFTTKSTKEHEGSKRGKALSFVFPTPSCSSCPSW
jgi:hypothetical protein